MGRRLRVQTKHAVYFITNRCFQERFLIRPSPQVNAIIRDCLVWAADKHDVIIYAFVFLSNHFHLLAGAPHLNMSAFMRDFQSQLARRINILRGRKGTLYSGRFHMEHVVDDGAVIDKLCYTLTNPVQSLLVEHPDRWPGFSSWEAHKRDGVIEGKFLLKKELRAMRRKNPDLTIEEARQKKTYRLELEKIPQWAHLSDEEYKRRLCRLVEQKSGELKRLVERSDRRFLGRETVLSQHWRQRPEEPKDSPQPLCHWTDIKSRDEHRRWYYEIVDAYKKAMGELHSRKTRKMPTFPQGTYPPGCLRCVGA